MGAKSRGVKGGGGIIILRLGHRLPRDERITTHVGLVARAFCASSMVYSGQHDSSLEASITRICESWGGDFKATHERDPAGWLRIMKSEGYKVAHLTMYGIPLPEALADLQESSRALIIIVGAEQVPDVFYELADFNISVTGQPHSEVAALAITLDRIGAGKALERGASSMFKRGKIIIEPNARGKSMRKLE